MMLMEESANSFMYTSSVWGIDIRVVLKHSADVIDNHANQLGVFIAQANLGFDAAVSHPPRVFHADRRKYRIWHIQRTVVEGINFSQTPTNLGYGAFNIAVWRADPITHIKRAIEVQHDAREKLLMMSLPAKPMAIPPTPPKVIKPETLRPKC